MSVSRFWKFLVAGLLAVTAAAASAETIAVPMGKPLARFDKLKPGTRTYVHYIIWPSGSLHVADIQTREVRFEGEGAGRRVRIAQRSDGPDGTVVLDSLFENKTLRPITHQRDRYKGGKLIREGFRFLPDKVVGIADQLYNVRRDFALATPVPVFNFETDLETLTTLPLHKGAEFKIVFYQPGRAPPQPYLFKVTGDQRLNVGGQPIDCWVVTTDYNLSRFWIAKDSQVVVRVHSVLPDRSAGQVTALLPDDPDPPSEPPIG